MFSVLANTTINRKTPTSNCTRGDEIRKKVKALDYICRGWHSIEGRMFCISPRQQPYLVDPADGGLPREGEGGGEWGDKRWQRNGLANCRYTGGSPCLLSSGAHCTSAKKFAPRDDRGNERRKRKGGRGRKHAESP